MSASNQYAKFWAIGGLGLAIFILNVDMTIVNLALPIIGRYFKASITELQWINNVYLLAMACTVIIIGKLSDIHGTKKVFSYGILTFFAGSLIAGLSFHTTMLITGRVIQGIGMAMTFPCAVVLANRLFPAHQRSMAIGTLITFTGIGQALGPTVGGLITQYWGWRFAFLVNLPICLLCFFLVFYYCNKDVLPTEKKRIHYGSAVLLATSLLLFLLSFNQLAEWGVGSFAFIGCIVAATILMAILISLQCRLKDPLIDLSIFKHRTFAVVNVVRPIFQYVFTAFIFVFPLYLQNILGFTPSASGAIILISTLFMAAMGPLTGKWIAHSGIRLPIITAQFLAIVGYSLLLFSGTVLNWPTLVIGLFLIGTNIGIMFSATNYTAVNSVKESVRGMGYGVFITSAFFFSALGVALSGVTLSFSSISKFKALLLVHKLHFNPGPLKSILNGARPITHLSHWPNKTHILKPLVSQSFVHAFHITVLTFVALSAITFFVSFFLKNLSER